VRVFITGLTGTLGTALARLHKERGDDVWGCARNESRAVEWLRENKGVATLFCCDASSLVKAKTDPYKLLPSMDRLYHLAAMKHVDLCEANPWEAYDQNVCLTAQVVWACSTAKVPLVFASSDKACMPTGVYGATKLLGEKIVLREGGAVVRLGNLIGSSGSVFRLWKDALGRGERIRLTNAPMTRYFVPVRKAAEFVADMALPGKLVVPEPMKSAVMGDIAHRVAALGGSPGEKGIVVTGPRPGETMHQWVVAPGDRGYCEKNVRIVLCDDDLGKFPFGESSEKADRWDVDELLREAGVES
jgi:FlaA1/EpsC-like NDP-sugar epimerase